MNPIDRLNVIENGWKPEIFEEPIFKTVFHNGVIQFRNSNGELHSINDQPAEIWPNGSKYWCKNGKLHRDGDKPAIICNNGSQFWYKNGKLYRDCKPAVIYEDAEEHFSL